MANFTLATDKAVMFQCRWGIDGLNLQPGQACYLQRHMPSGEKRIIGCFVMPSAPSDWEGKFEIPAVLPAGLYSTTGAAGHTRISFGVAGSVVDPDAYLVSA